jgi:hypothetical protein
VLYGLALGDGGQASRSRIEVDRLRHFVCE